MEIIEAVKFFGNNTKLALALGVGVNTVSNWKARGGKVPLHYQWQIELGTKGKLKADSPPFLTPLQQEALANLKKPK